MRYHARLWASAALFAAGLLSFGGCDRIPIPGDRTGTPPPAASSSADQAVYDGMTMAQLKAAFTRIGKQTTEVEPGILRLPEGPLVQLTQCLPEDAGLCYEISISRTFKNVKPTLEAVNKWNYSTKVPEASIDGSGFLHLEFWVTTVGLTDKLLVDSIGWFEGAWQSQESQQFWQPFVVGPNT